MARILYLTQIDINHGAVRLLPEECQRIGRLLADIAGRGGRDRRMSGRQRGAVVNAIAHHHGVAIGNGGNLLLGAQASAGWLIWSWAFLRACNCCSFATSPMLVHP